MIAKRRIKVALPFIVVFSVFAFATNTGIAAEIINVGTAYRTGIVSDAFPEFLKIGETDATTRAWNLNGSNQTLNGISVIGTGNTGTGDLTIFDNPNAYTGGLGFVGDPQQAAKDNIANK